MRAVVPMPCSAAAALTSNVSGGGRAACRRRSGWLALVVLCGLLGAPARNAAAACSQTPPAAASAPLAPTGDARVPLRSLVSTAVQRHAGVEAARLVAEAALDDLREAEAAKQPQLSFNASLGPSFGHAEGQSLTSLAQARGSLNLSQLLYDGQRSDRLVELRRLQADAQRLGLMSQQEQLALGTVSAAYELSRFRQQSRVYAEYVYSAACLVESLEQVVALDRGRLSELVQARKSLQQVRLTLSQTEAQLRQAEFRLTRYVGQARVDDAVLAALLRQGPELAALLAELEQAPDIVQLQAQAGAASAQARVVEAGTRAQLSLVAGLSQSSAIGGSAPTSHGSAANVGLALSIPLLNPGVRSAIDAAQKRAQAAVLQREDALDTRRSRVTDLHDQARSAFDRARQVEAILRDSERLRDFTLQQWQQLGRRSLFDVMAADSDHFGLRIAHVNAVHDGQQVNAMLLSLGRGLLDWLR